MRIVIDLDGIISKLKEHNESYKDVSPNKSIVNFIKSLKKEGHYVIIYTSRNMKTSNSNIGKVIKNIGLETLEWLERHSIPYDELYFGKPFGDVYIDDMSLSFHGIDKIPIEFDKKLINIVLPMAGLSKRFKEKGIYEPKYMIHVDGKTLFEWSMDSLPLDLSKNIIFIILKNDEEKYNASSFIKNIIKEEYPFLLNKFRIIKIEEPTNGQAETVYKAKELINDDRILLIYNIDSFFSSRLLRQKILLMKPNDIDGLIGVFESDKNEYSYVRLNEDGYVVETREKKVISNLASTGLYVFSRGRDFIKYFEMMKTKNIKEQGEFYIIPIYNFMIEDGKRIIIDKATKFISFGTPEEIEEYKRVKNEQKS